ncbi:saccharopine dehydrogenase NADP-binding domain-containing protein [Streptomyces sp. CC219B]|uniref:saccharopine dehydrogenase NADP-binding domain-containing protein n=1 Tax=Streptomyces sp. CC219B TaxID=3044574 RepID=UPI0024A9E52E|nr:saccharopine dehydrogenase NADP-binding domain-containing protein [Streptomyces sp. CC219B]
MTTVKKRSPEGRILVVGGYGAVGATVPSRLAERFPGRVLPAGRDGARARRLGGVRADVGDPEDFRRVLDELGDVGAVVLCVEPADASIARACLERGIHLVDVGASYRLLDAVSGLHALAVGSGATAVLSVGVAPGLTNLLALRAHRALGGADRLDLTVLLGSGERHGTDAVRWTVAGLAEPVTDRPRKVSLPGHGVRTAHPFPFSDQHTLRGTLGVPRVTTRLCLDSPLLTAALFAVRRTGGARREGLRRLLTAAFPRVHLGGDGFALRADAYDGDGHAAFVLAGREQSRVTGLVAAEVAGEVLTGALPTGVHHIERLPALADLPERLGADGVTVRRVAPGEGE